jgi:isoquinoline 1-oxidoreductase subunit alpha
MIEININGKSFQTDVGEDTPLLWVLRDELNITEINYHCGDVLCSDCTILVDGHAMQACKTPVGDVRGKAITSIQ